MNNQDSVHWPLSLRKCAETIRHMRIYNKGTTKRKLVNLHPPKTNMDTQNDGLEKVL